MTKQTHMIERLILPGSDSDLRSLAQLLVDAVESGAAVSFLPSLTLERAEDWWRKTITASYSGAIFLVARDVEGIVGTVQLHPAWAPNQPHREDALPFGFGGGAPPALPAAGRRSSAPVGSLGAAPVCRQAGVLEEAMEELLGREAQ